MKLLPLRDARIKLLLLSLMHFATDGLCAYLIFAKLYPNNPTMSFAIFIGYNLLAFVTQSPLGMLIDKRSTPKLFIATSAVAIALGYIVSRICLLAVLFIGLGNAAFHVGGGKYVTDKSGNDISHLGIFVSCGAIGLVLGQHFLSLNGLPYLLFSLIFSCTLLLLLSEDSENKEYVEEYMGSDRAVTTALLAVVGVVFARAFVGKLAGPDFPTNGYAFLAIAISTALGKAIGGILARVVGVVPTVSISMSVAAICLTLGCSDPYIYTLGVFAFNFSMPITLYYANILLKGKEGFAFGTLAAVLVPGYLIAMCFSYTLPSKILTAVLCILSVIAISVISRRVNNADNRADSDLAD